jgi:hypothetical protein
MNDNDEWDDEPTGTRAHLMDEEFVLLQKKVQEAVAALKEANAIADKKGVTLRNPGYCDQGLDLIDTYGLLTEIGKGGWRTSSMEC